MKFAYLIEPPFNFLDAQQRVTGCDVELARHVLKQIGVGQFEPVETEFSDLLPGLGRRDWEMTTGLFCTDDRRKNALFSRPIWALADGLLVAKGNPMKLTGYRSIASNRNVRLAVIRDQLQMQTAIDFGVCTDNLFVFESYDDAAAAVLDRRVDAYASVGRAHTGFNSQNPNLALDVIMVPTTEKPPAFGAFAFGLNDAKLCRAVDSILETYLGSEAHRKMMAAFLFSDHDVDLIAPDRENVQPHIP